jgi:hypothetical protein
MTRLIVRGIHFRLLLGLAVAQLPAIAQAAEDLIAEGTFVGKSKHVASGSVKVVQGDKGAVVVLDDNFNFDGAPDPKLGFGKDGYVKSTKFSPLKSNTGNQVYELPGNLDPEQYNEVWIWCEAYNVPLGVAKLK